MTDLFKSTSRFKNTDLIVSDGRVVPALMKKFDFLQRSKLSDSQILRYEVNDDRSGRPDLIANDIYGTTLFKWVLILFNNAINPVAGWPKTGTVIEAPIRDVVWREL